MLFLAIKHRKNRYCLGAFMSIFANLSIRVKILIIAAVAVIGSISAVAVVLIPYRNIILEQKKIATKNVVETAAGVLKHYSSLIREGKIDEVHAKQQALNELKEMRYEGGYEYFWVNDMHPTMVMHPIKPELDGKDLSNFKDPEGKRLFVAFVETVKRHSAGFVN
jgi:methyl-accepting chemotaxis protein